MQFPRGRATVKPENLRKMFAEFVFRVKTRLAEQFLKQVAPFLLIDVKRSFFVSFFVKISRYAALVLIVFSQMMIACRFDSNAPAVQYEQREFIDDLGRKVNLPAKIERAVSLAPNLTESIFAVGAGNRLVGVTTFCNFPDEAQKIQRVGDTINPNMETILALKPQVVFVSTASQIETFTTQLSQQNIAVFVTNPKDLDGVLKNLETLGGIFGTTEVAEKLIQSLRERISKIPEKPLSEPRKRVFLQISKEPLYTIGKESFLTELIARAGGVSVTKDVATAYPKLSKETAAAMDPEIIILSDSPDNTEPNEVFAKSAAVKNGRVFKINADIISRPGPRLVDALEHLAEDLR